MTYVRQRQVRAVISKCGPDRAVAATVDYVDMPYVPGCNLPTWDTYKALYQAGVVILRQDDPRFPYDYIVEPHPGHPLNHCHDEEGPCPRTTNEAGSTSAH
jgi:hypothetical protein